MSSPVVPMENARHIMARSLTQGIEGVFEKEVWVTQRGARSQTALTCEFGLVKGQLLVFELLLLQVVVLGGYVNNW